MKRFAYCILAFVLACGATVSSLAADNGVREMRGKTVRHAAVDRAAQVRELRQSLMAAEPETGLGRALTVRLSAAEKRAAEPLKTGRYRVGVSKMVGVRLDLSRNAVPFGARATNADGSLTWTGIVRAPGASALRLQFTPFDLPEGAELYLYGPQQQAFGPYTGRGPIDDGELWTNTVGGDEVRLQLRLPAGVTRPRLVLAAIGYMGKSFPRALADSTTLCPNNASCVVNANCATIPDAVKPAKEAVADMLFASGGFYYLCTGGLVANGDSNSNPIPYFLTANHCISKSREAASLETYFDYEIPCGSQECTAPFDQSPRYHDTLGAVIKSANRTGDYTLLQLSAVPDTFDDIEYYLGWTETAVANSNGTHLYRISHPDGSPQAYSEHDVDTSKTTCSSWPRGSWIYSRDVLGATEGGSSGSPVLNASGEIVGQLSGACGYNVNDVCDDSSNATVDGAFASYFNQVAPFLVGGGGGGECQPAGASCTMNSECCSNSCKGKPGAKVCK